MIIQAPHIVLDCPVCGRPVEIQNLYIDRELTCGHCTGRFVVDEGDAGKLVTAARERHDLLKRAEELLPTTRFDTSRVGSERSLRSLTDADSASARKSQFVDCVSPAEDFRDAENRQPVALLVEHRDEVYARIATDMAESGMHVIRAMTTVEALRLSYHCVIDHVVANLELPDQSGWLLACKLGFCQPNIRVWIYQADSSNYDATMARYLKIDGVMNYGGDLLGLSEMIIELIAERRMDVGDEGESNIVEEATTT